MTNEEFLRTVKEYIEDNQEYMYFFSTEMVEAKLTYKGTHQKLIKFLTEELGMDLKTALAIDKNIDEIIKRLEERDDETEEC